MQCVSSEPFRLSMFLMVSFLKKKLKIKLEKDQNKYIRFCQNLPLRSRIDPVYLRKIKRLPASDRAEQCIANTILTLIWVSFLGVCFEVEEIKLPPV